MVVQQCALCLVRSPRYDWGLVCCLARYVAGEPTQGRRRMWLERISAQQGSETAKDVEAKARALYAERKPVVRPQRTSGKPQGKLRSGLNLSGKNFLTQSKFKATDHAPSVTKGSDPIVPYR